MQNRRALAVNPCKLSDEALALIAGRFKVLSQPIRLKILTQLESGEKNVGQLVKATGATQANISRHLQSLAHAGIVCRRKEAQKVFYYICDESVFLLCAHVCGSLKKRFEAQAKTTELF